MTIHWVYPHDPRRLAAPWSIGNNVAAGLRAAGHAVTQHDWMDRWAIFPALGDVLIGHPHPADGYVFRNSLRGSWRKRIAVTPWNGDPEVLARLNALAPSIDLLLAICGPYWATRLSGYRGQAMAVDMAVDASLFPERTRRESPSGERRALYIGCTGHNKGTDWLEQLIELTPFMYWAHMGSGNVRGCNVSAGYVPIESPEWRYAVDQFDFIVCPGRYDANPTVALEGALCGLIPLCTPTSGWDCWPRLSLDPRVAADELAAWNREPLKEHAKRCRRIAEGYTWERFMRRVLLAVA